MVYQIQCAWCGKGMGSKEGTANRFALKMEAQGLPVISHGMCEACRKKAMYEIRSKDKGGKKND